jgi:ribA/ribD-fused uncharacterized protein
MASFVIHNDKEIKGFFGPYRFLSNFWDSPVYFEAKRFPSIEHAYQFAKLDDYKNYNQHLKIIHLKPGEIKKWGRSIKIRRNWEEIKNDIMTALVFDKFYRNKELRGQLLQTDNKYLEESNSWHDNYWGNCYCEKCRNTLIKTLDPKVEGQNNLGKILIKVREFWK